MLVPLALLGLSLRMLRVNLGNRVTLAGTDSPATQILATLGASVGLPYFVLSTTGPLLQAWYARKSHTSFPYRLFALSNLASLAALLVYPLGVEPVLSLNRQFLAWSVAYLGFFLLSAAAALRHPL